MGASCTCDTYVDDKMEFVDQSDQVVYPIERPDRVANRFKKRREELDKQITAVESTDDKRANVHQEVNMMLNLVSKNVWSMFSVNFFFGYQSLFILQLNIINVG